MNRMVEVDAIVVMPSYAYNYDTAHKLMSNFVKKNRKKLSSGSHIVLSFRNTAANAVNISFLRGLADYINAHSQAVWSVKALSAESLSFLIENAPNTQTLNPDEAPYVPRKPLTFKR